MPLPINNPVANQFTESYFSESETSVPSSEPWISKPDVSSDLAPGDWKDRNGGSQQGCRATLECGHLCSTLCLGFDHEMVACTAKCSHIYLCCSITCQHLCKEPHDHHCNCTVKVTRIREIDEKEVDEIQKVIDDLEKAAIAGEFSRGPAQQGRIPGRQGNKAFRHSRGSYLKKARETRKDLREPRPAPMDVPQDIEARQKWHAFANGGAKEMDDHLDILYKATDANSDDVRNAIANLDKAFIPREFLWVKEAQELQNQESKKVLKETEGPWQRQGVKKDQQSGDRNELDPHVAEGNLLDLD